MIPQENDAIMDNISLTKKYLGDPIYRIALFDHVSGMIESVILELKSDKFILDSEINDNEIIDRILNYEELLRDLMQVQVLLSAWGIVSQIDSIKLSVRLISNILDIYSIQIR